MALQAFQQRKYYYDFDPRSIGSCIGWYDTTDSNTIIYDTSGTIEAWLDKSGTARHLTQCNVNLRPGFRLSGIDMSLGLQRFDTSGFPQRLYEIFAVGYPDVSATSSNTLFHSGNNQRLFSLSNAFPGGTVWIKTPVQAGGVWAGLPDARQPTLISMNMRNDLIATLRMNGSQSTTTPTFTTRADISYIGNEGAVSSPWGVVNEILVYCNALTFKQRRFIEGYLAQKWRTTNIMEQPPAGFAPTDISGCSLWLDANDETQFDLSGSASNSVWVWRDKAGNRSDFSQNTVANRPTYVTNDKFKYVNFVAASQQTLLFDRPFLSNSVYNRAFSFFAVVTRDSTVANNCFFGATVNSSRNQLIAGWRTGPLGVDFNGDNTTGSAGDTVTSNALVNPNVVYFEHLGSNFNFRKNLYSNGLLIVRRQPGGSNLLGGTNQSIGIANLGASGTPYYQGRVCEVIFYDRVLPSNDVQKVHGYLFNKWYTPAVTPLLYPNHELRVARSTLVRDFRPSDIRNCILWLDAADPTTYTLNSNNVLTSWIDKSSNRNNPDICGNPVYVLHPSNQKYGFYFDQPSFLRGDTNIASNMYTVFLVGSIDASGATRGRIFGVTGRQDVSDFNDLSGVTFIAKTSTSNRICYLKGSATSERAPCDSSWNTPNVMMHGYDTYQLGTGQQMAHNNGVRGTTGPSTPTVLAPIKYTIMGTPGCNYQDNGNGYVFEALIYNSFLIYSEIDQVQTYLARKWGIDISSALYRANIPPISIAERPNAVSLDERFATQQFNCILWLDAMDPTTYTVSNNVITRLESKGVYGGSLTTSLGATYLPGYDATGINGRPCFTTSTTAPGPRLYGTYGYASVTWGGVRNQHTVIMVVQPTSNIDASFGRVFSSYGGTGNDSTTGSGFAIATSDTTSPFTISTLRFTEIFSVTNRSIISYRTPLTLTDGTPTILSYNGLNAGGNHTPTTWAIGSVANAPTVSSNTWSLKVGEVLVFQFAPSATETQAIEGYLARKWGIDLSDNHTYKYVRP